jgi:hypothetical protein
LDLITCQVSSAHHHFVPRARRNTKKVVTLKNEVIFIYEMGRCTINNTTMINNKNRFFSINNHSRVKNTRHDTHTTSAAMRFQV